VRSIFQRSISSPSPREAPAVSIVRIAVRVAASGSATDQRRRFASPVLEASSASVFASSFGSETLPSSKLGTRSPSGRGT
jgi:hypothetical protein